MARRVKEASALRTSDIKKLNKELEQQDKILASIDGRTKEARAFMKRMLELRAKRDASFRNTVKESVESFGNEYLFEANVDILRKIVKDKQNNKIKLKDGTLRIDLFSASALTQALDKVKPDTKKKMTDIINSGSKGQLMKLLSVIMK